MKSMPFFLRVLVLVLICMPASCCHYAHHSHVYGAEYGKDRQFHILATTFPVYIFAANICAGAKNINLGLLIPSAAGCPHDFAPGPRELKKLAAADAIVINGLGLEDFLTKTIKNIAPNAPIINAAKNVPTLPAVMDNGHEKTDAANPHIFAAPDHAALMAVNIATELAKLDPSNSGIYLANANSYAAKLDELAKRFAQIGQKARNRGIALEHNALAYLAQNANLEIVAIFEYGASAAALAQLEKKLVDCKPALLAGDAQYSGKLLKMLTAETGVPYALLNSCASGPENASPDYYETVMKKNLDMLEERFD